MRGEAVWAVLADVSRRCPSEAERLRRLVVEVLKERSYMSKVLVISDCHLKPAMFDKADAILKSGRADFAVQMGDLLDDWDEEYNLSLYSRTLMRAVQFHRDHPDTLWCLGNHDYGYYERDLGKRETGHSEFVEGEVSVFLREMERVGAKQKVLHIVDGVFFTHAGLTEEWMNRQITLTSAPRHGLSDGDIKTIVNFAAPNELWAKNSPLWARPQAGHDKMWPAKLQVVGHTPARTIIKENGVLSTDTFSTYPNGAPYGDRSFAIVDTETGEWQYGDYGY